MGRLRFLSILLVSLFLALCFSHGFGRKIMMMKTVDQSEDFTVQVEEIFRENAGKSRMAMEIMDYSDPEPNTNTKGGYVSVPPTHG